MKHKTTNRKKSKQVEEDPNYYTGNNSSDALTMTMCAVEHGDDTHDRKRNDFYEALTMVLNGFKYGVEIWDDSYIRMSDLLLTMIEDRLSSFYGLRFVKFINIFNNSSKDQLFNLECYLDFVHSVGGTKRIKRGKKLITSDRKKVDMGNAMLSNLIEMSNLLHDYNMPCKQFEYCLSSQYKTLTTESNTVRKKENYGFDYGDNIDSLTRGLKEPFNRLLRSVDTCYDKTDNGLTHYLFFMGSPWLKSTPWMKHDDNYFPEPLDDKDDIWKYSVCAVVGIDCRKEEAETIKDFVQHFQSFIEQLSFVIIEDVHGYNLRQKAVVASVAQVMARNMSHNIGSHVFSNLISNDAYSKLTDRNILKAKAYVSPWKTETEYPKEQVQVIKNHPENFQLTYFNQYLKSRMDYLSEVTFGIPNMLTTKYMYSDVFKELDRERILLNYISGIPGFKYTFCLKRNGEALTEENDIAIAFPSDVLGNQAFYNIIENVIRNTAKHAFNCNQEVNTFTIEFNDVEDFPEYYSVEIDNGIVEASIDDLVKKQNERINTSVLDKENNLRSHSLGLLEMKASAAFLRQVDIAKVDSYEYHFDDKDEFTNKHDNLILLKAINKIGTLGYRFLLQKPAEFLFVGEWDVDELRKKELLNCGIRFIESDDFVNAMEDGVSFAHPFLLYQDNVSDQVEELLSDDNDCKTLLPVRKLRLTEEEAKAIKKDVIDKTDHKGIVDLLKGVVWVMYYENIITIELKNTHNEKLKIRKAFDPSKDKDSDFVSNQIVFLDHGDVDAHNNGWKQAKEDASYEAWIENLSSRTSAKLPDFGRYSLGNGDPVRNYIKNIKKEETNRIAFEIFEAYHNKVIVLDERVQKFSKENYEGSSSDNNTPIPCSDLFESTNVLIPDMPLALNTFKKENIEEFEQFIMANMDNAYILIHYGILERMYGSVAVITEKLNIWAAGSKRLVVTSGRGAHSLTLPPSVCFVNLSSVLYAFMENRNKYIINNLLNQSRRKNG